MRSGRGRWPIIEKQDKQSLSDEALAQRSKALTLMGEIAASRGDLDGALRRYREALAGTAEALRRAPNDPQRMFDHAQSVYYVGSKRARLRGGSSKRPAADFANIARLADQDDCEPTPTIQNGSWKASMPATNLGRVELRQARYAESAATFQRIGQRHGPADCGAASKCRIS